MQAAQFGEVVFFVEPADLIWLETEQPRFFAAVAPFASWIFDVVYRPFSSLTQVVPIAVQTVV